MPSLDYNPDKERHVDHKWIVNKATKDPEYKGIQTSKGFLKFDNKNQSFYVRDEALAREVMQEANFDATVSRVRWPNAHDAGHRYHFGQIPALPWHKYDEFGRRIKEENEQSHSGDPGAPRDIPATNS